MTRALGFLSEKIPSREQISSRSATELRIFLLALAAAILGAEVLIHAGAADLPRGAFLLAFAIFWLLFTLLETIFSLFTNRTAAALLPILPALLLLFLLQKTASPTHLIPALLTAAAGRLFFAFVPRRDLILVYGCLLLDACAMYLYLSGRAFTEQSFSAKTLFTILSILTLAALQQLLNREAFPFYYFAILGAILLALPMDNKPIDWSPVVEAGETIARGVMDLADGISYRLSFLFDDDTYTAGYSSLDMTGTQLNSSESTQLLLQTSEKPYHIYTNPETSEKMRVRRTLYLSGGKGVDKQQLITFLTFLHSHGVDRAYARLFSELSNISVDYVYLDTPDEIAPAGTIRLSSGGQNITDGTGNALHRKGYQLEATYLDIDHGSPYLIGLLRDAAPGGTADAATGSSSPQTTLTYRTACEYAKSLYGIELGDILTEEEYTEMTSDFDPAYTDVSGSSERMSDLAKTITQNAQNDYDKCRLIEAYLRRFTYDTNAAGGHSPQSDMNTPEGMADIADRFLFETKSGYCVHYTSSMVMLLRLAGIPARVAKGYRYVFPLEEQNAYEVSAGCAHAWPEAYLGDAGWVPFEPTTAYRTGTDYTWHRVAVGESTPSTPVVPGADSLPETGEPVEPEPDSLTTSLVKIVLPVILSIALLLFALIAGTRAIAKLRYDRTTPEKRLQMDVEMIKKGIHQRSYEEFADRGLLTDYVDRAPEELRPEIKQCFDIYYRVIYGNGPAVTEAESKLARETREALNHKPANRLTESPPRSR